MLVEGKSYLPQDLRNDNFPKKRSGMSADEQRSRSELKRRRNEWLKQWSEMHVPAFFERFCTHALYRSECMENTGREPREDST